MRSEQRVLRIGMVGYGDVGRMHALCWSSLPFYYPDDRVRAEVVAVATSRSETARAAAADLRCETWSDDFLDVARHPDVDLVDVVSPDDTHAAVCLAAFEAGKHVLCEKPMAVNQAQSAEMLAAAQASRRVHGMVLPVRVAPAVRRARELLTAGLLGRPISFRSSLLHSGYIDPERPMSWRLDRRRTGGGALYDLGVHSLDLIRYLLGEITSVAARLETFVPRRPVASGSPETAAVEVDDLTVALAEIQGGAIGTLEFSRVATGLTAGPTLDAHGTDGALRFDFVRPNRLELFDSRRSDGFREVSVPERWPRLGFTPLFREVAAAALEGTPAPVTFADGHRVQTIMAAIQQSGRTGTWTEVPPAGPDTHPAGA